MAVKNLVSGVLAQSITTSTTNILVNIAENVDASGIQSFFPTPPFYITIMPKNPAVGVANRLDSEILQVTAVGNDQTGNASLTCVRGQRDTTAKAFDVGSIVTVGVYADDAVFLGSEGSAVENPAPWVESSDIKNGAITTDKIADGAVKSSKIDWTTSTIWSGNYYSIGSSNAQILSEKLETGRLYVIEVIGLSSSWKMQFPFIYTGDKNIQFAYYDGSSYARWRVAITSSASGFYLDNNSTNMAANTAITKFMRVM